MNTKMILIVRKDLNMRKGKIAAQCSHASLGIFLQKGNLTTKKSGIGRLDILLSKEDIAWLQSGSKKICVSVDSEEELLSLKEKAADLNLPHYLVTDSGLTEFNSIPTITVLAIGPTESSKIDSLTKHLKLL